MKGEKVGDESKMGKVGDFYCFKYKSKDCTSLHFKLLLFLCFFPQKTSHDPYDLRKDHLSPPLSSRGLSDSDMSELEDFGHVPGNSLKSSICQLYHENLV